MRAGGIIGIAGAAGVALAFIVARALKRAGDAIDEAFGDVPALPGGMAAPGGNRGREGERPSAAKTHTRNDRTHSGGCG